MTIHPFQVLSKHGALATALSMNQPAATKLVAKLVEDGVLDRVREGRYVRLYAREIPGWN